MRKYAIMTDGDDGWAVYLTRHGYYTTDKRKAKRFFTEEGARKFLDKQDKYIQWTASITTVR